MAAITIERTVAAPVEKVFALATDLMGAPGRLRRIISLEVLTPGPVGRGTRFRETRKVFNREATEEMEITEFDPPRGYVVGCESHGCRYRTEFSFIPNGEGTKLVMIFEATPISMMAKLMSPMMKAMMGAVQKEVAEDLDDIKAAAEA